MVGCLLTTLLLRATLVACAADIIEKIATRPNVSGYSFSPLHFSAKNN